MGINPVIGGRPLKDKKLSEIIVAWSVLFWSDWISIEREKVCNLWNTLVIESTIRE